jgi:hypothetical protein
MPTFDAYPAPLPYLFLKAGRRRRNYKRNKTVDFYAYRDYNFKKGNEQYGKFSQVTEKILSE